LIERLVKELSKWEKYDEELAHKLLEYIKSNQETIRAKLRELEVTEFDIEANDEGGISVFFYNYYSDAPIASICAYYTETGKPYVVDDLL